MHKYLNNNYYCYDVDEEEKKRKIRLNSFLILVCYIFFVYIRSCLTIYYF